MSAVNSSSYFQGSSLPEPINGKVKLSGDKIDLFTGALKSMKENEQELNTRVTTAALKNLSNDDVEIEVGEGKEFHHVSAEEYRRIQNAALGNNPALEKFRSSSVDEAVEQGSSLSDSEEGIGYDSSDLSETGQVAEEQEEDTTNDRL